MIKITSKSCVAAKDIQAILALSDMRAKFVLEYAYIHGYLYEMQASGTARSVVVMNNGDVYVSPISSNTLRDRVQAELRPLWE